MDSNNWKEAFKLYDTYGDLPLKEFITRIDGLSLGEDVRKKLIELKTSEEDSSDFFDSLGKQITELITPPKPEQLGPWKVIDLIERGGMSSVYLAERNDGDVAMKAAAKCIHVGGYNTRIIKRFKREIEFLTLLEHPNITRIIDWGVTDDGLPWYVMEFVEGMPITQYCNEKKLNLDQRLQLFEQVCDAVQHAHKNLVIHRDLKPSNIFIDTKGRVKLLDFGIAKAIAPVPAEGPEALLTQENHALMTPFYASPEQLESTKVSTASDVYSLGLILYELVTGRRPYEFDEVNPVKMLQHMQEKPVERPSSVFKDTQNKPQGIQSAKLRNELDDILMTCLRIEPDRRYASAEQLGRDIRNFLNHKPVMARPDSFSYRFNKFIHRNTPAVIISAVSALIILGAVIAVVWQAEQTRLQAERTMAMKEFMVTMVSASNPFIGPGETPTVRDMLEYGSRNVEEELSNQPLLSAEMYGVIGASYHGLGEPVKAREYLEKSLNLASMHRGLDPLTEAEIRATHANSVLSTGETEKARELAVETLRDIENVSDSERVQGTLLNLIGATYYITAEYDTALEFALEALEVTCGAYGETHSSCIQANIELQYFYEQVGKNEKALEAAGRGWRLAGERYPDEPHPQLIMAAGAYGSALSRFARTDEAIPILEENVEHSLEIYGEENFRYARGMDWLSSGYQAAGRTHDVLEMVQKLAPIGEAAVPGNPLTPVWLHREVQSAMHLRKPEAGRQALDAREERLPERFPAHISHAYEIQDLLIRHQEGEFASALLSEALSLVEMLEEEGSSQLDEARMAATLLSLNAGATDTSARMLEDASGAKNQSSKSDITPARYHMLEARHHLLIGDTYRAAEAHQNAGKILNTARHTEGPFLSEHQAIEAELLCRAGELDEGRAKLQSSVQYWREKAQSELGEEEMRNIADTCR